MKRFHQEEYQAALAEFESSIEMDAGFPEAWLRMGFCFGKLGDPGRKVEAFQKAVALKPDFIEARYQLGVAYLLENNRDAARGQVAALKLLDVTQAESLETLITIFLNTYRGSACNSTVLPRMTWTRS